MLRFSVSSEPVSSQIEASGYMERSSVFQMLQVLVAQSFVESSIVSAWIANGLLKRYI